MIKKISFRVDGDTLLELESYKKAGYTLTDCLKRVILYGGKYRETRIKELEGINKKIEYWGITPEELIDLDGIKRGVRNGAYQDVFTRIFTRKMNKKDLKIYLQEQIIEKKQGGV